MSRSTLLATKEQDQSNSNVLGLRPTFFERSVPFAAFVHHLTYLVHLICYQEICISL
jgi:hypothetical protein